MYTLARTRVPLAEALQARDLVKRLEVVVAGGARRV
jgi:hypothetical protein